MRYATTQDLLDEARNLHEGLARYYDRLAAAADKEKGRMLLEYLARHETNMAGTLAQYSAQTAKHIRDAWFSHELDGEFIKCIPPAKPVGEMDINEIIDMAIQLDDCIISLYQLIAVQSGLPEVREAFTNLMNSERKEKMRMVRQAMSLDQL